MDEPDELPEEPVEADDSAAVVLDDPAAASVVPDELAAASSSASPPPDPPAWLPTVGRVMSVGFRPAAAVGTVRTERQVNNLAASLFLPELRPCFCLFLRFGTYVRRWLRWASSGLRALGEGLSERALELVGRCLRRLG